MEAKHLVAFTGAGASTDSGIPDLDEINRILKNDGLFSYVHFHMGVFGLLNPNFAINNSLEFYRLYRKTFFKPFAQPNSTHKFLYTLEKSGILKSLITMNIDTLHQKAGSKNVIEYWGNMRLNRCSKCNRKYDWNLQAYERNQIPLCTYCGSIIIPEFVLRNLSSYRSAVKKGEQEIKSADVLIIIGTKRDASSFKTNGTKFVINNTDSQISNENIISINGNSNSVFKIFEKKFNKMVGG
ncbi:SIR2 family NAD-dependent protein deacylase [Bombilactobacillus bombi]|uniref:SIR2 family NAD-dependent protein deacylase n=1 Tax=Bombilactobacillus bombi TaxID=1303590 RepID=UPI001F075B8B|nr:Sir2 family NAD-dependent protein deacetylase [Bombilactobacillus bombi]